MRYQKGGAFRFLTYAVIPIAMEIEAVAAVTLEHEVVQVETAVFTGIAILTQSCSATTTIRDIEPRLSCLMIGKTLSFNCLLSITFRSKLYILHRISRY